MKPADKCRWCHHPRSSHVGTALKPSRCAHNANELNACGCPLFIPPEPTSSACGRQEWCNRQVEHDGPCSPCF